MFRSAVIYIDNSEEFNTVLEEFKSKFTIDTPYPVYQETRKYLCVKRMTNEDGVENKIKIRIAPGGQQPHGYRQPELADITFEEWELVKDSILEDSLNIEGIYEN